MSKRKTTEQFISDAIKVHGDRYDYSKVEYVDSAKKVIITCPIHGEFKQSPTHHLLGCGCKRCMADKMKSLCHGVGYNDYNGRTRVNGKDIPSYKHWYHMICRCYSPIFQKDNPTYKGCSVCEEWHTFSNFKKWFDKHYVEGYCLDKDILVQGNKVYSPDTCVFIPHDINSLFRKTSRNVDLPRGVNKYNSRYVAEFRAKGIHKKKYFSSKEEASKWYLKQKQQYIITLANDYYSKRLIHKRAYDGMLKYALENLV